MEHLPFQRGRFGLVAWMGLATAATASAATWNVNASGMSFTPANLTVAPGDTVHWIWLDGIHTVTSGTGCVHNTTYFDAPLDLTHTTFDFVVPTGVPSIPYYCFFHCDFGMTGLITVQSTDIRSFVISMNPEQETGTVSSPATGTGTATLDYGTNLLSWNISFSGLVGTQTAAHFHGPAVACFNASPVITLPLGSPIVGSAVLTDPQKNDLLLGRWYVNVHSTAYPGGEIRGQVMPGPLNDPIPASIPLGDLRARLRTVTSGLTAPNWGTAAPGVPGRLYVTDQTGIVWSINLATGAASVFLDQSSRLVSLGVGGPGTFDERGLLGLAFHPDYAANGKLYTYASEPVSGAADYSTMPTGTTANCQNALAEWVVPNPADPNAVVDPGSRRELLRIDKPQFNHNGGGLLFGSDGMLYVSTGDGGGADDQDGGVSLGVPRVGHGCLGNGQNKNSILGKILRIDVNGTNAPNGKYGIPASNPFVGADGLDEVYAYGLRNPWRISFDRLTGDLYCADVGQNKVEEVDVITAGGNYGWRYKEGSFNFVFNGLQPGYVTDQPLDIPAGLTDPIAEYDHNEGISVIGGFVYRGTAYPELAGKYVFGDFARTFTNDGRLFYLDTGNQIKEFRLLGQAGLGLSLLGFGEDAAGEVYVLANGTGTPFGSTGVVLKVASPAGDMNCDGSVNFDDINPFVTALVGQTQYQASFPNCFWLNGDANHDGLVNFDDINPFVALLVTGGG